MFRSIKVSVTLGAAVLIAAPGCCLPNLLCNHSSPSEETVVADYSSQSAGDYSVISADCGCGCSAGAVDTGMVDTGMVETGVVQTGVADTGMVEAGADDGKYIVGTPVEEEVSILPQESSTSGFQPTQAGSSTSGGSGSKVMDIVRPPVDLKSPIEASLPGNLLP